MELREKNLGASSSRWIRLAALGFVLSIAFQAVRCEPEPTESQCRPYIEKALKQQQGDTEEIVDETSTNVDISSEQGDLIPTDELTETTGDSIQKEEEENLKESHAGEGDEDTTEEDNTAGETEEDFKKPEEVGTSEEREKEEGESDEGREKVDEVEKEDEVEGAIKQEEGEREEIEESEEKQEREPTEEGEEETDRDEREEEDEMQHESEGGDEEMVLREEEKENEVEIIQGEENKEGLETEEGTEAKEKVQEEKKEETAEETERLDEEEPESPREQLKEATEAFGQEELESQKEQLEEIIEALSQQELESQKEQLEEITEKLDQEKAENQMELQVQETSGGDEEQNRTQKEETIDTVEEKTVAEKSVTLEEELREKEEVREGEQTEVEGEETAEKGDAEQEEKQEGDQELTPEEDLTKEVIIPENLRPRDHITKILRLDEEYVETESALAKAIDSTLKSLKSLYDNAIKPLEMLYKYRDLSNRHFGDPEIFSKPLILFMGPWSGGKSSTINYLLDNEFTQSSLRTGAEPSPAYFNILMYGKEEEVLDGTQLAADWTFSGLQKFGQGLLDRLKGFRLPNGLLEKVNIVEIPGILEIRKQVQRLFPFNDACQWFIDRADIIFLVYDPSKLDVGPETEAILDQLKGREYQTRIILNKADQVKPEELMRVQGTLIWNISPLMSSTEPPIMYSTSLWSMPYESGSPTRLLQAQEHAFLRDLREAIDKRVENKIASARRFAVRVRNHAKMVDCYLTTYYNHKTLFGNKKKISDDIIENPQKYHIYEGLSTLTNISRYDLPDPDVYKDFFKINPLYDFTKLSDTCTYFRGCPINRLDVAIAYDLPELVGKYKKAAEASKPQTAQNTKS